jgi:hypothetical protein
VTSVEENGKVAQAEAALLAALDAQAADAVALDGLFPGVGKDAERYEATAARWSARLDDGGAVTGAWRALHAAHGGTAPDAEVVRLLGHYYTRVEELTEAARTAEKVAA